MIFVAFSQLFNDYLALCFRFQHHRGKRTQHTPVLIPGANPKVHLIGEGSDVISQLIAIENKTAAVSYLFYFNRNIMIKLKEKN